MKSFARLSRKIRHQLRPPVDISDEYVRWVSLANAGMMDTGNLYCFDHAIRNLPNNAPIVEIGSFCGLSTNLLGYYKRRAGLSNPLFSCDKWEFEGASESVLGENTAITHRQYRDFVKDTFLRNVKMFSGNDLPHTIESLSDEFFAAWRGARAVEDVFGRKVTLGGPIGFCYIDGNHTYEAAKRDFENCDEFLERGGFVLFDDSADGSDWEVCRVVAEVKQRDDYELIVKNPNYLFRKK
jgi:hypothetical protein